MKKLVILLLLLLTWHPLAGFGQTDLEKDPAFLAIDKALDLKAIPPQVNVNLPKFLIKDAISGLNDTNFGSLGPELAELVKDVKLIRVVIFEADSDKRDDLEKGMKTLQTELDAKWTTILKVPEENINIYAKSDASGESMAGVALLIHDDGNAVVANLVGNVSLGKLIKLALQSKKLPKDLLQKLSGIGEQTTAASAPKTDKSEKEKETGPAASSSSPAKTAEAK
jgi:hypothetical protein